MKILEKNCTVLLQIMRFAVLMHFFWGIIPNNLKKIDPSMMLFMNIFANRKDLFSPVNSYQLPPIISPPASTHTSFQKIFK